MSLITRPKPGNVADLLHRLAVPAERVRLNPPPGRATEEDAIQNERCELIDGTFVEKAMGYYESWLGFILIGHLDRFLEKHDLGIALESAGMVRVATDQIRLPDVSFISWDHFPGRKLPLGQILNFVPDLAVEILSPSNTLKEMIRRRGEYFAGGAKLVWEVDPMKRSVEVFTAPDVSTTLDETGTLDGGAVLPGFSLPNRDWFARAGERSK